MEFLRYTTGLDMKQFTHIPKLSSYNSNYYKGLGDDIIYGKSDDNDTTAWYLIIGMDEEFYLGESYTSEGDKLYRYEEEQY
jgi:hypothetical protein